MAKFCMGVAPIKLEMGRYTKIPEDERLFVLSQLYEIESEEHVLIWCSQSCDMRNVLFYAVTNIDDDFNDLNDLLFSVMEVSLLTHPKPAIIY